MRKSITKTGIAMVVAAAVVLEGYGVKKSQHTRAVRFVYEQAQDMIGEGQYEEAKYLLEEIAEEEYVDMDISELLLYCEAQIYYESNDISSAYWNVYALTLEHMSEELQAELKDFQKEISEDYEDYKAEKEAAEAAAYEEKIRNGVPFVGMSESRIADTSLGRPSSTVRHNNEVTGGEVYQANLYDFVKNGVTYFTARCVQGEVVQVWDNRDLLNDSDNSSSGSGGRVINGESSSNSRADSESDDNDPYNVYDYDDPEEFYYDYYDDFDGYEDAETYWYDAWR